MQTVTKPGGRQLEFDPARVELYVEKLALDFPKLDKDALVKGTLAKLKQEVMEAKSISKAIYQTAIDLIDRRFPDYTFVATKAYLTEIYKEAAFNRGYESTDKKPYGSFYELITLLTQKGLYSDFLLNTYSRSEIEEIGKMIEPSRDNLFTYVGLKTLTERYLTSDFNKDTLELPQERFMVIAMTLFIKEKKQKRLELIAEAYWALSNLYMTVATPTLSNAGKAKGGQMSSCFIDSVEDSLEGIYDSNTDVARLSKMGGGIGVYMGNVRAMGSDIRGHNNASSGVVPWIRQLNNTAVSVDQLNTRQGAVAVYLDAFHKDILDFLDLKLNNGDERVRAHDIFPGIVINDLFMEAVDNRVDWFLFDPHEVKQKMGYYLQDFYDEEKGSGTFREKYMECVNNPNLSKTVIPAIEIMKKIMKSQLETGTPYMFYKDTVNRANPNRHEGIIHCSNLCTEIMQNTSPTVKKQETLKVDHPIVKKVKKAFGITPNDGQIIITRETGDFVVCNLSSINLGRAVPNDVLERLIPIQVRMLDNVIDINNIDVLQAQHTNQRYRAIGLGTFGLHHLLALKKLAWGSDEAVQYNDELYEKINFLTIEASMNLAKEKGKYELFKGSDWHTGQYFTQRDYSSDKWASLRKKVRKHGLRNGYLFAIAPNASTSVIAGSTASVDPIYVQVPYEEKNSYKIANPVPDLNPTTNLFYRSAYVLDQHGSIRMAAARQRHIDQAQSLNLYVTPEIKAKEILDLHMDAWKSGLKTTYYVRSQSLELIDCESCAS